MKTVLEAKNITKIYETVGNKFEALKEINLQVQDGELCKELHHGELTRKQFFQQVVDVMSVISGGAIDDVI